jgi:hypothetical protein
MQTITTTTIHPTTGEIMQSEEKINCVVLDNKHIAHRDSVTGRYCVSCFNNGIEDVHTQSSMSCITGVEYTTCYACKAKMEFKEVE